MLNWGRSPSGFWLFSYLAEVCVCAETPGIASAQGLSVQGWLQHCTLVLSTWRWSTGASNSNLALRALGHVNLSELFLHLCGEVNNACIMRS